MGRITTYLIYLSIIPAVLGSGCGDAVDAGPSLWSGRASVIYTRARSFADPGTVQIMDVDGTKDTRRATGAVPCRMRNGRLIVARGPSVTDLSWELSQIKLSSDDPPISIANGIGDGIITPTLVFGVVAVAADASRVAYLLGSFSGASSCSLYVASVGGGAPKLVSTDIVYSTAPAFSPDGTRIAFYADSAKNKVLVLDIETGRAETLAMNARPWTIENLDWDPIHDRIAYVGAAGERRDVYTVGSDSTGARNLTAGIGGENRWPVWSPDGTRIAFLHDNEVWTINADGTGARQITRPDDTPFRIRMYPEWSPDGTMILFTAVAANGLQGVLQVVDLATLRVNALASQAARGFWVE